ncbi:MULTISPECIES: response regulator transcription factor [Ramlibacter]|uniref:Response regulator n=1 Tax=Ramlibacter pinisoli TaxID=2682844 RepID=A0A6N8IQW3_9BURK|nr:MULTISPECIES: response regulator transcription factor [Ramlibacter]MBA2964272.1 response regulator transcription factor [Ramlibacter sp. CGMCC 1.13660]MVQ29238.1 response regulator [Ramlibacter pinisoli]
MRLLLLEDDAILGDGLAEFLRGEGHVVDWFQRLRDLPVLAGEPYDVLLVDWQLPDGSGLDWVRGLRARGFALPVLMLTARDLLSDRIRGLDGGADDYLVKPFAPEELAARLRVTQRRSAGAASARVRVGDADVDLAARSVSRRGREVAVTPREWQVLEALVARPGRVVTRGDLEALMLGFDGEVSSNSVEVHVSHLRRKLGADAIETVRGVGYRVGP